MPRKKKPAADNPMVVDEAEFTDVIRKMVNTPPVERKEVEGNTRGGFRRKKNPHTGPMSPVFPPIEKKG